jgi:hypothetical protein
MSLNVIRMTVVADLVIGDQHLWTPVADHWYQLVSGFQQIRRPEDSFPKHVASNGATVCGVGHAGIPISTVATESDEIADTQDLHG